MFSLFHRKPTYRKAGYFNGFTDWHCHILPGVDDGVKTMETALEILGEYDRLGFSDVWLTPHIMEDIPNTTDHLRQRFEELSKAWGGRTKLHLAAENMLDGLFAERLAEGDLLPIGLEQRHLLVETSYFNPPIGLYDMMRSILSAGYYPILAHPERYVYMDTDDYAKLHEMGILFQLNLPSLHGMYGETAQEKAKGFLKKGWYHLMATDLHRAEALQMLINKRVVDADIANKL